MSSILAVFKDARALLAGMDEDEVAAVTMGVAYWALMFDTSALMFVAYFSYIHEFRSAQTVSPAFFNTVATLLLLAAGMALTVRSAQFVLARTYWLLLLAASFLSHLIALIISTASNLVLTANTDTNPGYETLAGSDEDVDLIVYGVGTVSVVYHWIHFVYVWLVMLYLMSRGHFFEDIRKLRGEAKKES